MESSILSEVDDTSILRMGSPRRYACPLNWLPASRLLPRAAGWSAATLCVGPETDGGLGARRHQHAGGGCQIRRGVERTGGTGPVVPPGARRPATHRFFFFL